MMKVRLENVKVRTAKDEIQVIGTNDICWF